MIRYAYINRLVLNVYKDLPYINFPVNPKEVIKLLPNCKYISYQKLAKVTNTSLDTIIQANESKFGCTHYDVKNDRYLIMCNQSTLNNNNIGRQRWTCSHEIGHILCKHHAMINNSKLSECGLMQNNKELESEADYFAATLLAPFPLFGCLHITSVLDVQNTFGLSAEASLYRYKQYLKWKKSHIKTAWENDMIAVYKQKQNNY